MKLASIVQDSCTHVNHEMKLIRSITINGIVYGWGYSVFGRYFGDSSSADEPHVTTVCKNGAFQSRMEINFKLCGIVDQQLKVSEVTDQPFKPSNTTGQALLKMLF